MDLLSVSLQEEISKYFQEDDLRRNAYYLKQLPTESVACNIFIKSDLLLSGLPWFLATFDYLGANSIDKNLVDEFEGKLLSKGAVIPIGKLAFSTALTGERIALNLMQRASNIATYTRKYVDKAEKYNIKILDTRKTTPGLRNLEKYAVRTGGGFNHRLGQTDLWMIKDNHKSYFGSVEKALDFFKGMGSFYTPIELEVHDEKEFDEAIKLGIRHIMLDNFSPKAIEKIINKKPVGTTVEVSGGVTLDNLDRYLIRGVDAISVGSLTYAAPAVDISFKYQKVK